MRNQYNRILLNQLFNLFWTFLSFMPICWFWHKVGAREPFLYISIAIALIFAITPQRVLQKALVSDDHKFYERYGVRFIRKFVQDGDIVNSLTKKNQPVRNRGKAHAKKYLRTIEMYERYHWTCMVFFLLSAIIGLLYGYYLLGVSILAVNIPYNAFPIFLQQYNKVRIKKITDA